MKRRENLEDEQSIESLLSNPILQIPKDVLRCFEDFQRSRIEFVLNVDRLAQISTNIPSECCCTLPLITIVAALFNGGIIEQLKPLVLDRVPTVQNYALLGLARMASYNVIIAEAVARGELLGQITVMIPQYPVSQLTLG